MSQERLKMPSARLAVTMLNDADVLALFEKKQAGITALWAWVGLLLLAKAQKNNGTFKGAPGRYAKLIGLTNAQLEASMKLLNEVAAENGNKPWITKKADCFMVRSWEKWNKSASSWGGQRDNAGRPKNQDEYQLEYQGGIQDEYQGESSCFQPVSSPVSSPDSDTNQPVNTDTENGGGVELRLRRDDPISDVDVCARLLREVGVNGLALDFFPTFPGITPAMVMRACEKPSNGPLRPGLVIYRLKKWLKTELPSAKSIAPEVQRIQSIVKSRSRHIT
jgi:hypothetical protein